MVESVPGTVDDTRASVARPPDRACGSPRWLHQPGRCPARRQRLALQEIGHDRDEPIRRHLVAGSLDPRAHSEDFMDRDDDRRRRPAFFAPAPSPGG
jgi:hypothetical protein